MKKFSCRYPATVSLFILIFCIAGLLINGCSKKDQNEKQITENKPAPSSTFFTVPPSTDPFVLAIANSLQRQDVKGDIELQLSQHAGLAKWDNAIVAAGTIDNVAKGKTGSEDSVKVALIPFVLESYKQTNAMLSVRTSSTDTVYRLIYAGQYPEFGFGKAAAGKWNAFNLFHLFTRFDNAIFGHKKFLVRDKKILAGMGVKNQDSAMVELIGDKNTAAKLVQVPYCTDYDVCLSPCASKPTAGRSLPCCNEWSTSSYCTQVWIDDGNPTPPPTTPPSGGGGSNPFPPLPGGGGSGGGGGGTPVIDPCTLNPGWGGTPDHLCLVPTGGWQPVNPPFPMPEIINDVNDPCIKNSVNDAISRNCKNEITDFINTIFANSDQFILQFNDQIFTGADANDEARTSTGPLLSDITQTKTTIRFNTSQLGSASKEYIAATILHEAVHAWINYKFPASVDNAHQHSLMAGTNRFNLIRVALMEMYPNLSFQDATDLTWGGLYDTIEFSNLPHPEKERIMQKNRDYKNHTKGTPC